MDLIEYVTGIACLTGMLITALHVFAEAIGERAKILAALRGHTVPQAASDAPHASAHLPQLRRVEAAAEPAIQVRA